MSRRRKANPSKRHKPSDHRSCSSGKFGYSQKGEALVTVRRRGRPLDVYRCKECKKWHLANPVGRKERRRRAQEGRLS